VLALGTFARLTLSPARWSDGLSLPFNAICDIELLAKLYGLSQVLSIDNLFEIERQAKELCQLFRFGYGSVSYS
jgi:hypothetical protein